MIKNILWLVLLVAFIGGSELSARKLRYLEEFYNLHYQPHRSVSEDYLRNIHWLRVALDKPFAPPLYALTPPDDEDQYNRYKKLMRIHLRYLIVRNTVSLAARFDKFEPKFYNKPYKEDIIKSVNIADYLYREALKDWEIVMTEYEEVSADKKVRVKLEFLEKMIYRIYSTELDYNRVINRRLDKIVELREYFQ